VSQTCFQAIEADIDRPREARRGGTLPLPRNDNVAGAGRCPACKRPAMLAPASSEYRGKGLIHHHWHCQPCGHEWVTVLHVRV
jgi:hypothetical protein